MPQRSAREPLARHGRQRPSRAWRGLVALLGIALCVALVGTASVAAIAAWRIGRTVSDKSVDISGGTPIPPPGIGEFQGGFNVMLVGVDNDPTQSVAQYGKRNGTLNDVNILLHVAADHKSAVAVSIPRDMIVPIPSCVRENGKVSGAMSAQPINVAYSYGGLKCVVDTVSHLTGLTIPFAGLITFDGVVQLSNVVGGVQVCVNKAINDPYTGLNLPAGVSTIQGAQAAAFVRSRHGVGDGSDLGRISSQQVFLSSLVRKLKSEGVLGNLGELYQIADAASKNMTLSTSLANPLTMISLAKALKDIPLDRVVFVQYPSTTGVGGVYQGKVAPVASVATQLFAAIKSDKPIGLAADAVGDHGGSELAPSAGASGSASQSPSTAATKSPSTAASKSPSTSASRSPSTAASQSPSTSASESPSSSASPSGVDVINGLRGQTAAQQTCSLAYVG